MNRLLALSLLLMGLLGCGGGGSPAPSVPSPAWDPERLQVSRAELEDLQARYDALERTADDADTRARARLASQRIGRRLDRGDFRAGDRILLQVIGEETLPDTVVVEPGPAIVLENMGRISLEGVLRSELTEHLTRELARYIRDPRVTARSMVRLSVQGSVGSPGFYVFPAEMLLEDVIMGAGGPTRDARLDEIEIRRGEEVIMEDQAVRQALAEGRSIDQLNLQGGDELEVPRAQAPWWRERFLRWGVIIASTLLLGIRLF